MNKSELITQTVAATGLPRKDAQLLINTALETICAALEAGETVQLTGFGTLEVRQRAARTGRNPATGEAVPIPPAKIPVFTPSQGLKDRLNK